MTWLRMGYALVALTLVIGLGLRSQARPLVHSETLYVFGTLVEIVIAGERESTARAATADLGQAFQHWHRNWHAWDPGTLTALDAAIARGESFDVGPELAGVLRKGQDLSALSGGLFDPGISDLIGLWGFHANTPPEGDPPTPEDVAALLAQHPTIADLRFDGSVVSSVNPHVALDLGGFAKGSALELAAARLRARGIDNAVLNAGGDVVVLGTHGDRAWRIAVRDPFGWGAVAALTVRPGESVFTSGNYERFLDHGGHRFSHILDPRTGWPVDGIVSATVLTTDPALADAAATALSVAGRDAWAATAAAMGITAALLIDDRGQLFVTPEMAARLEIVPNDDHPWPAPLVVPLGGA